MKIIKIKSLIAILLFTMIIFLCGCSANDGENNSQQESQKIEEVRVASWSKSITEQINLLVDEEKGFYKDKGINVTLIPGAGGGDAIKNILTNQADIAFTDPGSLYAALDKGEKLVAIYNIYPQNVFNVISLKEKILLDQKI
ncbi:NMT1/THI5 like [Desulfonispora thiosulfatigenes DSM 11270]|uniref:NMT1/THI5 like n=1 Tax=Desulfonispora thiosulfatigenes DSM 11270 TaxID=656914 RepID=A0A1W1UID9_DESTI|nr:ABC transporter substrate-binding protein [Desulfonispora thiosulfatigenes]SMB80802.1 NMT1/THI5 like [Desulfonispora thiosulfatigenes DSM 11270]